MMVMNLQRFIKLMNLEYKTAMMNSMGISKNKHYKRSK